MRIFILGLLIFFIVHSSRIFADDWRSAMIARLGILRWKGLVALFSLLGFYLLLWGYAQARGEPTALWRSASWGRPLAMLLTLPAFVFVVAAYVPGNRFKTVLGHPMLAGTMLWSLAHLAATGALANVLLFGCFFVWAAFSFAALRRRDRAEQHTYPVGTPARTVVAVIAGFAAWAAVAAILHGPLIGVSLFG